MVYRNDNDNEPDQVTVQEYINDHLLSQSIEENVVEEEAEHDNNEDTQDNEIVNADLDDNRNGYGSDGNHQKLP